MKNISTSFLLIIFLFSFSSFAQEFTELKSINPVSSPRELIELGYDGENTQSVSAANVEFIVATKLTAAMITPYIDKGLVKVKFYISSAPVGNSVTIYIYAAGTASSPGAILHTQVATVTPTSWNTKELTTPLALTAGDLWIGIKATSGPTGSQFWPGCDAGPNNPNGQYMFWAGAWTTLNALGAFPYNWNIRGIVDTNIPVELSSFSGSCVNGSVKLNWTTASELNNRGFEVQRKASGSEFITIAFINGQGSTTETTEYSYSDRISSNGIFTYRLKQVDFNGISEYSYEIEVDAALPSEFTLNQNYPNPFNPSTVISFSLAVDSKVSVRVFNLLGQEVASLFNGTLSSGRHEFNLNLSGTNSGIYFYQLEAAGIDGSTFRSVKKMTLSK
jgi:hypothetical protein